MLRLIVRITAAAAAFGHVSWAYDTNEQVGADLSYGAFQAPSVHVRPRFRDWIPDASVSLEEVTADVAHMKSVGMGGLELLRYHLYGNYPFATSIPTDWTLYGWGTDAWKKLQVAVFQAVKDNGMIFDFALGPNQGAGVPADENDPGVMWDLWPFNVSAPIGG